MMLEQLFMILCGALQVIICGILGYIAGRIGKLYELMINKVDKPDCQSDMCKHETEIRNLWNITRDQGERIAKLEK